MPSCEYEKAAESRRSNVSQPQPCEPRREPRREALSSLTWCGWRPIDVAATSLLLSVLEPDRTGQFPGHYIAEWYKE